MSTTLAGIAKLRSFSSIRFAFWAWSISADRPATRTSRRSIGGRVQSIAWRDSSAVGAAPPLRSIDRAAGAPFPDWRTTPSPIPVQTVWLTWAGPDRGAGSSRMLVAAAAAAAVGSSRDGATGRPLSAAVTRSAFRAERLGLDGPSSSRRRDAAAVDPNQRAVPVTGWRSSRSWRLNASISPMAKIARQTMNAPGPVRSGSRKPARNRPIRPPPRSAPSSVRSRISNAPRNPTKAIAIPVIVAPQPELGRLPGPHSRYQPAPRSRNGSAQRPVSNHGAMELRHQSVSAPWPGRASAMSVTAPTTSRKIPRIDRPTSGGTVGKATDGSAGPPLRRREVRRVARRFVAIVRPRPRPGRPSAAAWSARTGSATRRP